MPSIQARVRRSHPAPLVQFKDGQQFRFAPVRGERAAFPFLRRRRTIGPQPRAAPVDLHGHAFAGQFAARRHLAFTPRQQFAFANRQQPQARLLADPPHGFQIQFHTLPLQFLPRQLERRTEGHLPGYVALDGRATAWAKAERREFHIQPGTLFPAALSRPFPRTTVEGRDPEDQTAPELDAPRTSFGRSQGVDRLLLEFRHGLLRARQAADLGQQARRQHAAAAVR